MKNSSEMQKCTFCKVKIIYEGALIEGDAYRQPRDYGCILHHAGYTLESGLHRPYFNPQPVTMQDAELFAKAKLGAMYQVIKLYCTKKDLLIAELKDVLPRIAAEYRQSVESLQQRKSELKRMLKAGETSQAEYQHCIGELRDAKSSYFKACNQAREIRIKLIYGECATKVQFETMRFLIDLSTQDITDEEF